MTSSRTRLRKKLLPPKMATVNISHFTKTPPDAEETTSEEAATEDVVTPEATADIPDETTAKAVTETVAEAEDVLAEATGAVANAAAAETSEVIGDEYMGLSDVSEDPSVLSDQDKLDV